MKIELYRAVIPANKLLNENHGQHYRIQMGKQAFLQNQFEDLFEGRTIGIGSFKMPDPKEISKLIGDNDFVVIMEAWRPKNYSFDPLNYTRTYKVPLDLLIKNGYAVDDNWKYISSYNATGGGGSVWPERAFRYEDDGLPDELTLDWWMDNISSEPTDMLIRIIFDIKE